MSNQQHDTVQSAPQRTPTCVINPAIDFPDEAEKFLMTVYKHSTKNKHSTGNVQLVAAELAPLFGFGPDSTQDVLARARAYYIFISPEIKKPRDEFVLGYTRSRWGIPLPKFAPTLALVKQHRDEIAWRNFALSPVDKDSPAEEHYARFIILMLKQLEAPYPARTAMLNWLRNHRYDREETWTEDVCWIYFHTLMFLQLKAMEICKKKATFKDRARHRISQLATPDSFCGLLCTLSRKGLDGVEKES
ncbi:hypothetical protein F5B22DRAFT_643679 [Xylaria bambusicola]|uniref:uncharacterized protein n=1 Tax=Xylaria bambusicola TaxID=326684 RepID=UPI0020087F73|nr:uncharacterized protein F5B22DRAFT_643679 [Xylaria bambusicola]KAI0521513.1 hypothetical protein F5B22DRAFT_643679 [Xylaria bambusicola]